MLSCQTTSMSHLTLNSTMHSRCAKSTYLFVINLRIEEVWFHTRLVKWYYYMSLGTKSFVFDPGDGKSKDGGKSSVSKLSVIIHFGHKWLLLWRENGGWRSVTRHVKGASTWRTCIYETCQVLGITEIFSNITVSFLVKIWSGFR